MLMKQIGLGFILLLSFCASAMAQLNRIDQVMEADKKLNEFISKHQTAAAGRIYTDDFLLTTSSGKFKSKQDMLNEISLETLMFEINETTNVKVRIHENTAVLTGVLHQKGSYNQKQFDIKLMVTDTWIYEDSNWKLLSGHASIIQQ